LFERFTDRARRVVVLAQEEARMLNHNYIGTEHILLGLIHEGEGVAARALESLSISLAEVRARVEEMIGQGQAAPTGHIPFTPRAKKVLELSLRESLKLGHNYIGTEHILLGLVREGEGVAAQVLVKLGAGMETVRRTVIEVLEDYTGEHVPEHPGSSAASVMGLSPEAHSVIRLSNRIASKMGHPTVQSVDLLMGLLGSAELDVAVMLQRLGVDLALLKRRLEEMAVEASSEEPVSQGLMQGPLSDQLRGMDERIAEVRMKKEQAIDAQDFERAARFRDDERRLLEERRKMATEATSGSGDVESVTGEGPAAEAEPPPADEEGE
jgi:ATP-dependent Clp protease ATP-binding subunit ClpA